jgi:plasmid stabilization system protein ParE
MAFRVILKPGAEDDTDIAYNWYENQQLGLGEDFLKELEFFYEKLEQNPTAFGNAETNVRQVVLKRFPYVIVFEIEKKDVVVYGIFHKRQRPDIRRKRKQ